MRDSHKPFMELQSGKTPYSYMTFDCDNEACIYYVDGRCVYNVSRIQSRISRACYEELREVEIECELDYLDGTLI